MDESAGPQSDSNKALIEHLAELRSRLIKSIVFLVVGMGACWFFIDDLIKVISAPIQPYLKNGMIFTAPQELFLTYLKVAFLAGIILSCPFWLFQVWRFIAPGLYANEKRFGVAFILSGTLLFITGICFVYFAVYSRAFDFLLNFGVGENIRPEIKIGEYLSFFTTMMLAFGFAFELPLVLTLLGIVGIVDHEFLRSKRRYAIVVLAGLSAFTTPPDVMSMVFLLGPLILLYESSIWLVKFFGKNRDAGL